MIYIADTAVFSPGKLAVDIPNTTAVLYMNFDVFYGRSIKTVYSSKYRIGPETTPAYGTPRWVLHFTLLKLVTVKPIVMQRQLYVMTNLIKTIMIMGARDFVYETLDISDGLLVSRGSLDSIGRL